MATSHRYQSQLLRDGSTARGPARYDRSHRLLTPPSSQEPIVLRPAVVADGTDIQGLLLALVAGIAATAHAVRCRCTLSVPARLLAFAAALCITAFLGLLPIAPASATSVDVVNTEVSFGGGQTLHGTVVSPPAGQGHRAGLVLVAGAGSTNRGDYRPEAEAFARAGIVTLIYDKRAGYSRATTSFDDLAADAVAGVELLRGRPDVEPSRVGLWGHSQGGWVVPLAASRSPRVGFVVTVGASGLRTDRAQLWSNRTHLSHVGATSNLIEPIGVNLSRVLIAADLFGDTGNDPLANLRRVRQPLLGVFGDRDRSTAPGESLSLYEQALQEGGNTHYTLRVVHDADHTMRLSSDGFSRTGRTAEFAHGYTALITSWIDDLAAGPPVASADPPPAQESPSRPVLPLAWYESVGLQVAALAVMVLAFLAYPVGAAVHRLYGHRGGPQARGPARVLAAAGPITVLGTAAYVFSIVSTGATAVDTTVLGRPPAWLALQLLAIGVVAALVITVIAWRRENRRSTGYDRVRLGALMLGAVVFVPWAGYWGLFTV